MNISETAVTNVANLPLFMVNASYCLLRDLRQSYPESNILDLKAHYRGHKYVDETIKMLPQKPDPFLLMQIFSKVVCLGLFSHRPTLLQPAVIGEGIALKEIKGLC